MVYAIAAVSVVLLGVRPWRVPPWLWPAGGALLAILIGAEPVPHAAAAIGGQWNVLLFILGLTGIAAAAEESGAFALVTDELLVRAGGSRRRLFVLLFVSGAIFTLLLSNDATALVLTPLVYRVVSRQGSDAMPFLFGCTFVADTASFGLPFSNPANVLILPHPDIIQYLLHLGLPQVLAIALNLAIFLYLFRGELHGHYDVEEREPEHPAAKRTLIALGAVSVAYLRATALRIPLGPVAFGGAAAALFVARVTPQQAYTHVSRSTFAVLLSLFVLFDAVARHGFVGWSLRAIEVLLHHGQFVLDAATALGAALFSNVFNNLPVSVLASHVVATSDRLAYPLIVGVDLGPNLTTTGSLATILWFAALRKRGTHVSRLEYLKLGAIVVPSTIAVCVLWLWMIP